jgi:hypothetical protein
MTAMVILISCEQTNTPAEVIEALEGRWKVEENSQFYKSTTGVYYVTISTSQENSSRVFLSNFYDLGQDKSVSAVVNDYRIDLDPEQEITALNSTYVILSGTGTIADDYQSIQWSYEVDDGSGQVDHATAVFTKN